MRSSWSAFSEGASLLLLWWALSTLFSLEKANRLFVSVILRYYSQSIFTVWLTSMKLFSYPLKETWTYGTFSLFAPYLSKFSCYVDIFLCLSKWEFFSFYSPLSSHIILIFLVVTWIYGRWSSSWTVSQLCFFLGCGALRSGAKMLICCFDLTALSDTVNIPYSWALVGLRVEAAERWRNMSDGLFSVRGLTFFFH